MLRQSVMARLSRRVGAQRAVVCVGAAHRPVIGSALLSNAGGVAAWSTASPTVFATRACASTSAPADKVNYSEVELLKLHKSALEAFERGDFPNAIACWEKVAGSQNHSKDSPTLMSCLNNLACAYGEVGDNVKKLELLERSREMVMRVYGKDHPQYGMVLYNAACAKEETGHFEEMKTLLEESLRIHEQRFNPKHAKVGRILLLLSSAYGHVGDYTKQLTTATRAAEIVRRHCGAEHIQTTIAMLVLAKAYGANGKVEQQLQTAQAALDVQERRLGATNPQLALTLIDVAAAHSANKDYFSAKEMLERAVSVQQRAFGMQHTHLVDTYIALGDAYGHLGEGERANQLHYYQEALKVAKARYQGRHVAIGRAESKAALGYLLSSKLEAAGQMAQRARSTLEANLSPDHPFMHDLAKVEAEIAREQKTSH